LVDYDPLSPRTPRTGVRADLPRAHRAQRRDRARTTPPAAIGPVAARRRAAGHWPGHHRQRSLEGWWLPGHRYRLGQRQHGPDPPGQRRRHPGGRSVRRPPSRWTPTTSDSGTAPSRRPTRPDLREVQRRRHRRSVHRRERV